MEIVSGLSGPNFGAQVNELDDLGRFTYQPPEDLKGMLRYRFFEYLSSELKIPYVMFVSMWFSYNNDLVSGIKDHLPKETNWLYMIAPVKVISNNSLSNGSISSPLELQTISREEAYQIISQLKGITSTELEIDYRPTLSDNISLEFSYEHIKSSPKGVAIKKWAQDSGKKCPACNIAFSKLSLPKIHFGHILSQSWCSSFGFLQDRVHNPDNLYLSCDKCNISLSKDFPNLKLRELIASTGTVGDWIRLHENEIRAKMAL